MHTPAPSSAAATSTVVAYTGAARADPGSHEYLTLLALSQRIARLRHADFGGEFQMQNDYPTRPYFVPADTITSAAEAARLGIANEDDLFGGVAPAPFIAEKTITHPLVNADAAAPSGWAPQFASRVGGVVLPGFAAFTKNDAQRAGERLLPRGAIRIKPAGARGGLGQCVAQDKQQLGAALASLEEAGAFAHGIVLEVNLQQVDTHSVGQVRLGGLLASYCGMQTQTRDNAGAPVYGGSQLFVVRGDFDALLRHAQSTQARTAIMQARIYHDAAFATYSGLMASRCNYDIAQGTESGGAWRSGVLEQSWRIGGASGAELAALQAFSSEPSLASLWASTTEVYGPHPAIPDDADVYCRVDDARVGPITKYSRLLDHGNA